MSDERPDGVPEGPYVEITPQRVFCPGHGEHFRAEFPKGFPITAIKMFQAATAGEGPSSLWAIVKQVTGEEKPGVDGINVVTETRPLCYFVDRDTLGRLLRDSEIGRLGRCAVCSRSGLGGPYQVSVPQGIQQTWLCFECALDSGERIHRAHPDGHVWPQAM